MNSYTFILRGKLYIGICVEICDLLFITYIEVSINTHTYRIQHRIKYNKIKYLNRLMEKRIIVQNIKFSEIQKKTFLHVFT